MATVVTRARHSIGDLLKKLRDEIGQLFSQEVALAKTEMEEKLTRAALQVAYLAAGALIAFAGLLFLLLAVTAGLAVALIAADMPAAVAMWLAPLLVGVLVAIVGYGLTQSAISTLRRQSVVPRKTIRSLEEDQEWLSNRMT